MKLIICGNGFDQHHRLPTNYTDYCMFLKLSYPKILRDMGFSDYFVGSSSTLDCPSDRFWTDVEKHLTYDFIGHLDNALEEYRPNMMDEDPDYDEVAVRAEDGLGMLKDFTGEPFYEWLLSIPVHNAIKSSAFVLSPDDYYVTFNYTDTLEIVYGIPRDHILHIHGSIHDVSLTNANFVSDEARMRVHDGDVHKVIQFGNPFESEQKVHEALRKHYQDSEDWYLVQSAFVKLAKTCGAMSKNLKSNYNTLQNFLKDKNVTEISIMGHSFLGVDKAYYDDIWVKQFQCVPWTFYWYSKEDFDKIQEAKSAFGLSNVTPIKW